MTTTPTEPPITLVAAMNYRRVIGDGQGLLWNNCEDLAHFKEHTDGHIVVMGRKTFDTLPFENGFPNRWNIVMSRYGSFIESPTFRHALSITSALHLAQCMSADLTQRFKKEHKIFCVGGGDVYRAALPHASAIYLTTMPNDLSGEVTFPVFEHDPDWRLEKQEIGTSQSDGSANVYTYWQRCSD